MKISLKVLFVLFFIFANVLSSKSYIEVDAGKSVILPCESNKNDHFFSFWELPSQEIISPGNNYNKTLYEYEVLTGKLHIFNVMGKQTGIYTCVSRGIKDSANVELSTVHLFVNKSFSDEYRHNQALNLIGILILVGCAVLLVMVSSLIYIKWKRKMRLEKLLDDNSDISDIEEMPEERTRESFDLPSTSHEAIPLFNQ